MQVGFSSLNIESNIENKMAFMRDIYDASFIFWTSKKYDNILAFCYSYLSSLAQLMI